MSQHRVSSSRHPAFPFLSALCMTPWSFTSRPYKLISSRRQGTLYGHQELLLDSLLGVLTLSSGHLTMPNQASPSCTLWIAPPTENFTGLVSLSPCLPLSGITTPSLRSTIQRFMSSTEVCGFSEQRKVYTGSLTIKTTIKAT